MKHRILICELLIFVMLLTVTSSCKKDEAIIKKDVTISWANPGDIISGTALSATQLNASADVTGAFVYSPAIGTVLNIGNSQNLKVDFTPNDVTNYNTATKTVSINIIPSTVADIDGNVYNIIAIGTQIWMKENLQTTKYRNGDAIGTTNPVDLNIIGESTPKYQWAYNGDVNYIATNGRLYTWYAATDSRNICPAGWHLPTDSEWTVLNDYLTNNGYGYGGSGRDIAKSLAATSGWSSSSSVGVPGNDQLTNNITGFTIYPSGCHIVIGLSADIGNFSYMWSSSDASSSSLAKCLLLSHNTDSVRIVFNLKGHGFSARCVKN